ncbi:hypothetical protein VC83_08597 [Pseudogymnoascus destructans]|uniref:Uncharacterized protein n=1 Tax=Pseudogymnoascus destructans TaxID=655981 RepID=A0A177A074_9PEZI|nr:uncharacterized protein VC83_08597 [Pseudogymnoascus destructans]OAF54970.1 hypothetical protein VC83_08597 [Pseudogymnoascus destructans]
MRPLSEPLHGRIDTEDPFTACAACAESETTKPLSARHRKQSPRRPRSSQHGQLIHEDCAYCRQATPEFDNPTSEEMQQQQQDEEENINSYDDDGLQQSDEDTARVAPITELADELPPPSPSLYPSQEQATSNSDNCSDDEPSTAEAESDDSDRRRYPTKRKRSFLSYVGPTQGKRRQHLQPSFTQEGRNCSQKRPRWKPHNHGSRVVPACGSNSQLPSPPSSFLGCGILSESSKHTATAHRGHIPSPLPELLLFFCILSGRLS